VGRLVRSDTVVVTWGDCAMALPPPGHVARREWYQQLHHSLTMLAALADCLECLSLLKQRRAKLLAAAAPRRLKRSVQQRVRTKAFPHSNGRLEFVDMDSFYLTSSPDNPTPLLGAFMTDYEFVRKFAIPRSVAEAVYQKVGKHLEPKNRNPRNLPGKEVSILLALHSSCIWCS
jgi:hypothetical protein